MPKRAVVGDTVTLTDESGTVPLAKDPEILAEYKNAKDHHAKSVAITKGITKIASGTEAVITGETPDTYIVKITRGIYAETTGVVPADADLEEYNRELKKRNDALALIAARDKEKQDRLAKQKAEHEQLATAKAAADAKRAAEEKEAKRQADELARKRAEEEYEEGGLVVLLKTVKGTRGRFGGEITGTVVNRTGRTLSYAQITYSLYDESGARVGTAIDNINSLEPGESWNFKAVTLENYSTYKLAKLTRF